MESPFETLEQHDDHAHSDETSHEKADAKLGSSTKERLGGLAGGLETSNRRGNFNGLRVTFLFRLLEED